jgi:hypothetical protein
MSQHADFDEAWYLQPHRPPAAQLLYNLGLEYEDDGNADELQEQTASPTDLKAPWPHAFLSLSQRVSGTHLPNATPPPYHFGNWRCHDPFLLERHEFILTRQ